MPIHSVKSNICIIKALWNFTYFLRGILALQFEREQRAAQFESHCTLMIKEFSWFVAADNARQIVIVICLFGSCYFYYLCYYTLSSSYVTLCLLQASIVLPFSLSLALASRGTATIILIKCKHKHIQTITHIHRGTTTCNYNPGECCRCRCRCRCRCWAMTVLWEQLQAGQIVTVDRVAVLFVPVSLLLKVHTTPM